MPDFDELLAAVDCLSTEELDRLSERIRMRRSLGVTSIDPTMRNEPVPLVSSTRQDTDEQLVLDAVSNWLRAEGLEFVNPKILRGMNTYRVFKERLPGVMEYLRQATKDRQKLRGLLMYCITLLYRNMREQDVPISPQTMLGNFYRVPAILNQAFPGYAQSGVLSLIVRQEISRARNKSSHKAVPPGKWGPKG